MIDYANLNTSGLNANIELKLSANWQQKMLV